MFIRYLQARFAFMKTPVRLWNMDDIKSAVLSCVTLHNMNDNEFWDGQEPNFDDKADVPDQSLDFVTLQPQSLQNLDFASDINAHNRLKHRIINHIAYREYNAGLNMIILSRTSRAGLAMVREVNLYSEGHSVTSLVLYSVVVLNSSNKPLCSLCTNSFDSFPIFWV
jgi:hypothetical protein